MQYDKSMLAEDTLKGRVVLVTGGGTGLGKSMSHYFAKLGAHLVLCSRKQEVLDQAAKEIHSETGAEVLAHSCDIRSYDEVEALKVAALERFGSVDVLVNNAAGNFVSPTERLRAQVRLTPSSILSLKGARIALCVLERTGSKKSKRAKWF